MNHGQAHFVERDSVYKSIHPHIFIHFIKKKQGREIKTVQYGTITKLIFCCIALTDSVFIQH